eukprot:3001707-Pyramimonas_sp.AAC.1
MSWPSVVAGGLAQQLVQISLDVLLPQKTHNPCEPAHLLNSAVQCVRRHGLQAKGRVAHGRCKHGAPQAAPRERVSNSGA